MTINSSELRAAGFNHKECLGFPPAHRDLNSVSSSRSLKQKYKYYSKGCFVVFNKDLRESEEGHEVEQAASILSRRSGVPGEVGTHACDMGMGSDTSLIIVYSPAILILTLQVITSACYLLPSIYQGMNA